MITGDGEVSGLRTRIEAALDAGVDYVQLRRKKESTRELEQLAIDASTRFRSARTRFLVNERFDVALAAGLGGVHLPADGLPPDAIHPFLPPGFLVGVSTHERAEAVQAAARGASFVVFGPVFPTSSKPGHPGVGIDALAAVVASVTVPVLALGGVTPERLELVTASGAAGIAGISVFERPETLGELMDRVFELQRPR
jgi:thiamine-phosphate pyrophosphorylase